MCLVSVFGGVCVWLVSDNVEECDVLCGCQCLGVCVEMCVC